LKKKHCLFSHFATSFLMCTSNLTDSPKLLLIDDVIMPTQDTIQVHSLNLLLFVCFRKVVILLLMISLLHLNIHTDSVKRDHAHNLQVHAYMFRNEHEYLHFKLHPRPI
ncbi:unnamed protein product, partial [Brassica oleracea var. botrytis]